MQFEYHMILQLLHVKKFSPRVGLSKAVILGNIIFGLLPSLNRLKAHTTGKQSVFIIAPQTHRWVCFQWIVIFLPMDSELLDLILSCNLSMVCLIKIDSKPLELFSSIRLLLLHVVLGLKLTPYKVEEDYTDGLFTLPRFVHSIILLYIYTQTNKAGSWELSSARINWIYNIHLL